MATSFLASLTRVLGEKVLSNVLEWCATSEFFLACKVVDTHLNGESSASDIEYERCVPIRGAIRLVADVLCNLGDNGLEPACVESETVLNGERSSMCVLIA